MKKELNQKAGTKERLKFFPDKGFLYLICVYLFILLLFAAMACFFSYSQRKQQLFSKMDLTFLQLRQNYQDTLDNFWQLYMPIYEKKSGIQYTLQLYFSGEEEPDPFGERELREAMQQMLIRDDNALWIALLSEKRDTSYMLFQGGERLVEIPETFPYWDRISFEPSIMETYETRQFDRGSLSLSAYAVSGNFPSSWGKGKIIVGYGVSEMDMLCRETDIPLSSLRYEIYTDTGIIYDSAGDYSEEGKNFLTDKSYYVRSDFCGDSSTIVSYGASWKEIFTYAHKFTASILLTVLLFAGISLLLYFSFLYTSAKEIGSIQKGLSRIGANDLDARIPLVFRQSGMLEIAASINAMTVQLKENINRAYEYEQKQKEAELSDLYTKFNPHFLYNSLEMLCSRCYQNGDSETAELITQLSAIFRGLISSSTFIPLQDELTFCKRYIALFGARYGERVSIRYDFSADLLQYGIIRNIFQPVIENYFIHGFEASALDSYILFSGKSLDDRTMLITVEDNGSGMSDEEIAELNARLAEPAASSGESYGLKNLHQRLRLFYGNNCGLQIIKNSGRGITIQMTVLKLTCEEVEIKKRNRMPLDSSLTAISECHKKTDKT